MGSNINEFIIKIGFAPDGTVDEVRYWDQEGCGHEHLLSLGDDLDDVIQYHLMHYRVSHEMLPPRKCPVEIKQLSGDGDVTYLQCVHDPHGPEVKHRFEVAM